MAEIIILLLGNIKKYRSRAQIGERARKTWSLERSLASVPMRGRVAVVAVVALLY